MASRSATPESDASPERRHVRVSRPGVRTRLLVLVVVPLVGVATLASSVTWSLRARAERAGEVERIVDRVSRAVDAETAMRQEAQARQITELVKGSGLSMEVVGPILNVRPGQVDETVAATDRALVELGDDGTGIDRDQLHAVRTAAVAPDTDIAAWLDRSDSLLAQFAAVTAGLLDELHHAARATTSSTELTDAVTAVLAVRDLLDAQNAVFVGGNKTVLLPAEAGRGWHQMIGAYANLTTAGRRLDAVPVPGIAAEWADLQDEPSVREMRALYEQMLAQSAATGGAFPDVGGPAGLSLGAARGAFVLQEGLYRLLATATTSVHDAARILDEDARQELRQWALFAGALTVTSIALSLWCRRTILRPLHRLADNAGAVSRGDLELDTGGKPMPREVAVAFEAMGDLVATLQVLEAKTEALAAGDLDAPALSEPLPGALGRSLDRSAEVLSGSLTERDRLREHLMHQASHDRLTGLHNRHAATDALGNALTRRRPEGERVAVVVVDLDDFKRANDSYGHDLGDKVLQAQADRVARFAADTGAFAARVGADEFVVILERVTDVLTVTELVRRLLASLCEPLTFEPVTVAMSASAGIAFADDSAASAGADQVLAWADLALQRAKRTPGAAAEIYDEGLQEQLRRHVETERALEASIDADAGLFLLFQPVLDVATQRPVGAEALVRWDRPGHGIQPPDSFIPVAESSDLIIKLDRWVIRHALAQMQAWSRHPVLGDLHLAVNVSGRHLLSRTLHRHVAEALEATGVDPGRLIIEITETILVDDLDRAALELAALRDLGVRVAIDDFGTGYTSLGQLQQLPADIIKIDRSFIQGLDGARYRTLTAITVEIAHQLGARTVAEGIETDDQLEVVRSLGCDEAQGYLFARPLPPRDLAVWVHEAATAAPARVHG